MAFQLKWRLEVSWAADGAGPMGAVPTGATLITTNDFNANGGYIPVPGGDTPTAANFNTAIGVTMTAAMEAFILANLGRIQAFATGGG